MDTRAHQAQLQEFQDHPPATREPIYIYFKYNDFTYTTRAYANSVFSDAEWQSPERTQRIEYLKKAAVKLAEPGLEVLKQEARVRNVPPGGSEVVGCSGPERGFHGFFAAGCPHTGRPRRDGKSRRGRLGKSGINAGVQA